MDISVIIPIYNVETYIEECLKSVACQTCLKQGILVECILVDDCGTDKSIPNCLRFIQEYSGPIAFQILHHDHNRGLSAARNTGMEVAHGEYLYFLDSDDALTEDCLYSLYDSITINDADMAVGNYCLTGKYCESLEESRLKFPTESEFLLIPSTEVLSAYLNSAFYMMAWNKLIRKDFLIKHSIRFIEGLIHEDNPWSLLVARHAPKTVLINHVTYKYLIREGSLQTGKEFNKHFVAYSRILQEECTICGNLIEEINRLAPHWPKDYHHITETIIRLWIEKQKAFFFGQVVEKGTIKQQIQLYQKIKTLMPFLAKTRSHLHYSCHCSIGFFLYKLFYKDYLI